MSEQHGTPAAYLEHLSGAIEDLCEECRPLTEQYRLACDAARRALAIRYREEFEALVPVQWAELARAFGDGSPT